jgi:CheY-like chemotaxis protein
VHFCSLVSAIVPKLAARIPIGLPTVTIDQFIFTHSFAPSWRGNVEPNSLEKKVILVVENEAIIRLATAALLEDAGYTAVEACDADIAIQILERRNDVRAVFTDVIMPGSLDGLKLTRAIRDRWPPIHLLVTSGLSAPKEEEFPIEARFLRKPYAPKLVLKALDDFFSPDLGPYRYSHNIARNYGMLP